MKKRAGSEITEKWIDQVKKAWKYHKSQIERASKPKEFERVSQEASHYFTRLQEDLLINKGFWYVLGPYDDKGSIKVREKITQALKEASDGMLEISFVSKMISRGRSLENLEDMVQDEIQKVDRALSRIVFATLRRELKKVEKMDFGSFAPNFIDLRGMKFIFEDRAEITPQQAREVQQRRPTPPMMRDTFLRELEKARKALDRKGFGHLWYGKAFITDLRENIGGEYSTRRDHITLSLTLPPYEIIYTTIHELGHRHWYRFMTPHDRKAFSAYFETGEVSPVSEYGETNSSEDFAETFAHYVLGNSLDRDQVERFKTFFTTKISSIEPNKMVQRILERYLKN